MMKVHYVISGEVYDNYGYVMDPHTAVAYDASKANPGNNIISTAHWAKFADTIKRLLENFLNFHIL